jgi:hypothetical protein
VYNIGNIPLVDLSFACVYWGILSDQHTENMQLKGRVATIPKGHN